MRLPSFRVSLLIISSVLIASAQTPEQPSTGQIATIRGVVVTANDKKPIPKAIVELASSHRSVTTNEKGEFVFTGVPFGTEVVVVKKTGFLCSATLRPHPECVKSVDVWTPVTQVELTLLAEAIVTGRVVDQQGTPIPNLALRLLDKQITEEGLYAWRGLGATNVRTDANGVFRMAKIEAGSYLLIVPTAFDPPTDFPPPHPDHGYSAAYYPGVVDQKEAQPLVIHAGDEVTANLTVRRESVQAITVNFLRDLPVDPGYGAFDSTGPVFLAGELVEHTHSFRFLAPPGDYEAVFQFDTPTDPKTGHPRPWPDGTTTRYFGSAKFTVRDQPVTIENLPVQQPVNLSVQVHAQLTGKEKQQDASAQFQSVAPAGAFFQLIGHNVQFNSQFYWRADKASGFEFKDTPPGQYVLRSDGNHGAYVASLTCGSLNLLREPLVIGPGIPICSIEAVIRDDLATLSIGLTPQAEAQMAAYGTGLTDFALIPVDNPLDLPFSGFVSRNSEPRKVRIPPGSYIAFLFDGSNRAWREPEFQERLKRLGTHVTLIPGDHKTLLLDFKPELDSPMIQPIGVGFGRVLP